MRWGPALVLALLLPAIVGAETPDADEMESGSSEHTSKKPNPPALAPDRKDRFNNPWDDFKNPTAGGATVIGNYSAGCIVGAEKMELSEPGIEVMRPHRNRYYGHPELLRYVRALGKHMQSQGAGGIFVGDLSQPRGGPTMSKHISHQNGLDADIWFRLVPKNKRISRRDRNRLQATSLVNWRRKKLTRHFKPKLHVEMLKFSAQWPSVERVLVNPVIKQYLCKTIPGQPAWLGKLRPWWGHSDHIHVRIGCPDGDAKCEKQNPPPKHADCGENLAWWFSEEAEEEFKKMQARVDSPTMPDLPAACRAVLKLPDA